MYGSKRKKQGACFKCRPISSAPLPLQVAFGAGLRFGTGLVVVRSGVMPGGRRPVWETTLESGAALGEKGMARRGKKAAELPPPAPRAMDAAQIAAADAAARPAAVLPAPVSPRWSAPCAVGLFGLSIGLEAGVETVDLIIPINDQVAFHFHPH